MFRIDRTRGRRYGAAATAAVTVTAACLCLASLSGCTNAGQTGAEDGTENALGVADDFEEAEALLLVEELENAGAQQYYNTTEVYRGDFTTLLQMSAIPVFPTYEYVTIAGSGITLGNYTQIVFGEYLVSEGSMVQEGDALFTFSLVTSYDVITEASRQLQLQRSQEEYEAYAASQAAQQAEWYAQIAAMEDGIEKQIQTYEYTKAQLQLEASLQAMQENIEAMEAQLSETSFYTVTAPISGIVSQLDGELKEGDEIFEETQMGIVSSASEVLFEVEDADRQLRCGQQVTLHSGDYWSYGGDIEYTDEDISYSATVVSAPSALSPDMQRLTGFTAYLRLEDGADIIVNNMYSEWGYIYGYTFIAEVIDTADVLLVDASAVQKEKDTKDDLMKTYVYVLEDGKLHKRFFTSGGTNVSVYWVIDGLEEGMTVVIP